MQDNAVLFLQYSRLLKLRRRMEGLPNPGRYEDAAARVDEALTRLAVPLSRVTVAGEFNRGKSTLINALVGRRISSESLVPLTRFDIHVRWGAQERFAMDWGDGERDVSGEVFEAALDEGDASVRYAVAELPAFAPGTQIDLVDTAGLNDGEEESLEEMMRTDLLVWVLSPDSPLSQTECAVLNRWLEGAHGRLMLVLNKIDRLEDEAQVHRLIEQVRLRFSQQVAPPERCAPAILAVSALNARRAGEDAEALAASGVPGLWREILTQMHDARREYHLSLGARTLRDCEREMREIMDAERQALTRLLRDMDGAQARLRSVLESWQGDLASGAAQRADMEACVHPDSMRQTFKRTLSDAMDVRRGGMSLSAAAASSVSDACGTLIAQISVFMSGVQSSVNEALPQVGEASAAKAAEAMARLIDDLNASLRAAGDRFGQVHMNAASAFPRQAQLPALQLPALPLQTGAMPGRVTLMMGVDAGISAMSTAVDSAFALWKKKWAEALSGHRAAIQEACRKRTDALSGALSQLLEGVKRRAREELDGLNDPENLSEI